MNPSKPIALQALGVSGPLRRWPWRGQGGREVGRAGPLCKLSLPPSYQAPPSPFPAPAEPLQAQSPQHQPNRHCKGPTR